MATEGGGVDVNGDGKERFSLYHGKGHNWYHLFLYQQASAWYVDIKI